MSYSLEGNAPPSKVIYINSEDAQGNNGYYNRVDENSRPITTDFTYSFPTQVIIPENVDTLVSLETASIPYSFYNIRTGINDTIDFALKNGDDNIPDPKNIPWVLSATIPAGNYTIGSLYTSIKYYMLREIVATMVPGNDPNQLNFIGTPVFNMDFFFYYDRIKQKSIMSFLPTWIAEVDVELYFLIKSGPNHFKSIYKELGLENNDYQNFYILDTTYQSLTPVQYVVGTRYNFIDYRSDIPNTLAVPQLSKMFLSPYAVDISGIRALYIRTNLTSTGTLDTQTGNFSRILAKIPINVNAGQVISFVGANDKHRTLVNLDVIKTIGIRLTDERNRLVNLNGLQFQIGIQLDFLYNKPPIEPLDKLGRRQYSHYLEREEHLGHKRQQKLLAQYDTNQDILQDPKINNFKSINKKKVINNKDGSNGKNR